MEIIRKTIRDDKEGIELDVEIGQSINMDGTVRKVRYKVTDVRYYDKHVDEDEKQEDMGVEVRFGDLREGGRIFCKGHFFKIVNIFKEYPNGNVIPYYVNLKLERLPDTYDLAER
jgi:hypothetical protein